MKMVFILKLFFHSGLLFKHLCLGCLNSLCCLSEIFTPTPCKPWSGDEKGEKGEMMRYYQDKAQKGWYFFPPVLSQRTIKGRCTFNLNLNNSEEDLPGQ